MTDVHLVAIDLNDRKEAARIVARARALADLDGADLHLLNVVPESGSPLVGSFFDESHADGLLAKATDALRDFASEQVPNLPEGRQHVMRGGIYDQILKAAKTLKADLIVVGAHRPELRDYLIGPNAARVARHATTSVYIVR